jgi:hypothetical protein
VCGASQTAVLMQTLKPGAIQQGVFPQTVTSSPDTDLY